MAEAPEPTRVRLVAFDLDGTLLRGDTVCEALARKLGHLDRMRDLERLSGRDDIRAAREEMAAWYRRASMGDLRAGLESAQLAPGAREGILLLKRYGLDVAIVSITWEFAVEWFARRLGADHYVGTRLSSDGQITHFWPADKARWVTDLARQLGLDLEAVAAIGDSAGDVEMLQVVGRPYFVGQAIPTGLEHAMHYPDGNIRDIAEWIVGGQ